MREKRMASSLRWRPVIDVDDPELLARTTQGDRRAFDELMRRHENRVFGVCLRILRQREAALDAVQDTFITVFRKAGQFRGDSQFSTWLYRVAVNTCYDQIRRTQRRPADALPEGYDHPDARAEAAIESAEMRPDLTAALAALSAEFRAAVVLVDVEGQSVKDTAEALGVAEGTVKSRLHRGRKELAQILGNPESWG